MDHRPAVLPNLCQPQVIRNTCLILIADSLF